MVKLIYIDTNVYLDYFKIRHSGLRPSDEFAYELLHRAISCEFEIATSFLVYKELNKHVKAEKINWLFDSLRNMNKLKTLEMSPEIKEYASKLSKEGVIHYEDALHYATALAFGADAIITNDSELRMLSSDKLPILLPEHI